MSEAACRITSVELNDLVRANRIFVSATSPLAHWIEPGSSSPSSSSSIPPGNGAVTAISHVAAPAVEMGILLSPPFGGEILWFYKGQRDGTHDLFGHRVDRGSLHQFAVTTDEVLATSIRECLRLTTPTESHGVNIELSKAGYFALLSLVDCNRWWTLNSLLEQHPLRMRRFTLQNLCETFIRTCTTGDHRWLLVQARRISPFPFEMDLDGCRLGLEELAKLKFVTQHREGWELTPPFEVLCTILAQPISCCGLHASMGDNHPPEHIAGFRAFNSLWVLEFPDFQARDARVKIRSTSSEEAELIFGQTLFNWSREQDVSMPAVCPHCGQTVCVGRRFCKNSGRPMPADGAKKG